MYAEPAQSCLQLAQQLHSLTMQLHSQGQSQLALTTSWCPVTCILVPVLTARHIKACLKTWRSTYLHKQLLEVCQHPILCEAHYVHLPARLCILTAVKISNALLMGCNAA